MSRQNFDKCSPEYPHWEKHGDASNEFNSDCLAKMSEARDPVEVVTKAVPDLLIREHGNPLNIPASVQFSNESDWSGRNVNPRRYFSRLLIRRPRSKTSATVAVLGLDGPNGRFSQNTDQELP
jgi:hypothetical protein